MFAFIMFDLVFQY